MEKIFLNKRLVAVAFFTVFSTTVPATPIAYDNFDNVPVELKFIRWIKDQPVFQFSFAGNSEQNEFTIAIKDQSNNILYRENIVGENFSKSFVLNTNEIANDTLNFEIISKRSNRSKVYEISSNTFIQQETA